MGAHEQTNDNAWTELARHAHVAEMLVRDSPQPVALLRGGDLRLTLVNPAYQALAPQREVLGRTLNEVWTELGIDFDSLCRSVIETGEPYHASNETCFWKRTDEGLEPAYYVYSLLPVEAPEGGGRGVLVVARETTNRERVEEALRESEARFREMVDGLPLIVWMHGASGEQELVNETFCEFFGVSREEMKGGRWQLLMHPDDADAYRTEFFGCVRERRPFHGVVRVRHADGQWRWIESWARPRFTTSGMFSGYIGTSADITNRIKAEEQLRESDRRKDEFLAMLGHELRNPLAAIRSATELLDQIDVGDPRLERVQGVLQRQTVQMKGLVDGLLEVSRIVRGKIALVRRPVDVKAVLSSILQDYERPIDERGVTLDYVAPSEPLWLSGDAVRLTQILDNVLGNALKFTPRAGTITLRAERDGDDVVVSIRDTGVGIRREFLSGIFEPFQQETPDGMVASGLGLGLAVARSLVELHGGTIEARSAGPGHGAEFEIRLPLAAPPEAILVLEEHGAPSTPKRILLVEDNVDAALTMRELLEMEGHEVYLADDGLTGMERLRARRPDLVLCDIGLPGISGYELARRIRADAALREVVLVALTGFGRPDDRDRAKQAGFDEHLTKPVDISAVREIIGRLPT